MDGIAVHHVLFYLDVFRDRAAEKLPWSEPLGLAVLPDVVVLVERGRHLGVKRLEMLVLGANLLLQPVHDSDVIKESRFLTLHSPRQSSFPADGSSWRSSSCRDSRPA